MTTSAPGEPFVPAPPPDGGFLRAVARPPERLRIALAVDAPLDVAVVDPVCRRAAEDTAALLAELGHHVEPMALRLPDGRLRQRLVLTAVAFQRLTAPQIEDYVARGEWEGKAGGYAIQGRAECFVRFLSGSHSNVVGLPLFETRALLTSAGLALG